MKPLNEQQKRRFREINEEALNSPGWREAIRRTAKRMIDAHPLTRKVAADKAEGR